MPSMILQPIVENSVNHGIREMADRGKITLRVFRQDEYVCIMIKDNGKGMSEDTIERVLNGTWVNDNGRKESNGIGMDNVVARIRLFTDDRSAINISSEGEWKGVETTIRIPYNDTENNDV